ncbi:MAG: hypothetical protein WCA10_21385 [Terracidiphilus sp.]
MELLDRYLQAVRKYLPVRRQDDIIAELRANMESQIEDKESELNRPLTQGEMEDLLREMGPPLLVASRYQPQQCLIGPALFPAYLYVLRIATVVVLIVYSITVVAIIPLIASSATGVAESLMRIPGVLIMTAAWVTLAFAALEFFAARYPEKFPTTIQYDWSPSSLPALQQTPSNAGKPRTFVRAVAEVVMGFLLLAWLLLLPRYPFLVMGPGAVVLQVVPFALAPVWWTFYWWVVGINVLQLGWKCLDLAMSNWQYPNRTQRMLVQVVGLIPLAVVLSVSDHAYVLLKNPAVNLARYGKTLDATNWSIRLGLSVVCAIAVLSLMLELGQLAWKRWQKRAAAE